MLVIDERTTFIDRRIEPGILATNPFQLGEEHFAGKRLLAKRPEDVEADYVSGPFPNAVDGRLSIDTRHHRFFNVARPAMRLEALVHERNDALVDPILCHRNGNASEWPLSLIARR